MAGAASKRVLSAASSGVSGAGSVVGRVAVLEVDTGAPCAALGVCGPCRLGSCTHAASATRNRADPKRLTVPELIRLGHGAAPRSPRDRRRQWWPFVGVG